MPLRITCPGCKTALTLDDDKRGRKVRCDHCDKMLSIPEAPARKERTNPDAAVQEGRKLKTKAAAVAEQEDDDEEQEEVRPAKKKKKKKKKSSASGLLIAGGGGILVLLILAVGASAYYFTRTEPVKQFAKDLEKKIGAGDIQPEQKLPPAVPVGVPIVPGIKAGNPDAKKGGSSIVNSVRGAGYRAERRNELRQIGLFFQQFCDGTPKSARTKENFLDYIKRDSKILHENISEGYYVMNMRADFASSMSIIAYERDLDRTGHLAVRGDLSVDYVPLPEMKQILGK